MSLKGTLKHALIILVVVSGCSLVVIIACTVLRVAGQPIAESPDTMTGLMLALVSLSFLSIYMKGIRRAVRLWGWSGSIVVCIILQQIFNAVLKSGDYSRTSLYAPSSLGTAWDLATLITFTGLMLIFWRIRKGAKKAPSREAGRHE